MKKKMSAIKWFRVVEGSNCADNYCEYEKSIYQPSPVWRPVNPKYCRQKVRFLGKV